jgi:aminopeptidase-like protein
MTTFSEMSRRSPADLGLSLPDLIRRLYPICRSITGNGLRQTLSIVGEYLPLEIHEVPSGTQVLDWSVPREWNVNDAYIADSRGRRVIDFQQSNLHLVNYSVPTDCTLSLAELRPHLHTLPGHPDWIPYVTSYYRESWGFCLSQNELDRLPDDMYRIVIDSSLADGHLTYGELFLPGRREDEILLTTHACHPSLCNDNLSGIAILTALGSALQRMPREYSYRLLFIPGTIGAITWLARNRDRVAAIRHGLVLAGLGTRQPFTYKRSRRGAAAVDRAAEHILSFEKTPGRILDFSPYGYDERQFCSPGFDLPMGRLSRAEYGTYAEYHTSADNPAFLSPEALTESWAVVLKILSAIETDRPYRNLVPYGEPQLGKRGLYDGDDLPGAAERRLALLWILNLSDGSHTLLDIAERAKISYEVIRAGAERLEAANLIAPAGFAAPTGPGQECAR